MYTPFSALEGGSHACAAATRCPSVQPIRYAKIQSTFINKDEVLCIIAAGAYLV